MLNVKIHLKWDILPTYELWFWHLFWSIEALIRWAETPELHMLDV